MADPRIQFEQVIQTAIDSSLKEVHTALPGVVQAFDPETQLADIQVTIQRKLAGELVNLPLLAEVPVRYFRCGGFTITAPLVQGDHVLLIFAERSIDTWLTSGEISNPADVRRHTLSDAFAIPMMFPQTNVISNFDNTNIQIRTDDGGGFVNITPNGNIELNGNADSVTAFNDMKAAFDTLVTNFNNHIHLTTATVTGGDPVGVISVPTVSSTADMSGAEVPTVKVP